MSTSVILKRISLLPCDEAISILPMWSIAKARNLNVIHSSNVLDVPFIFVLLYV